MNGVELGAEAAARRVLGAVEAGASTALVMVVESADREAVGRRLLLIREPDGSEEVVGTLPLGQDRATEAARAALDDPRRGDATTQLSLADDDHPDGDGNDGPEVYIEVRRPIRDLVIVGAGHVARPLSTLGALLGYRVVVVDDRPAFATRERFPDADRLVRTDFSDPFADVQIHDRSHVLLVTRGHKYDYECLVRLLKTTPAPMYVGMIGSRRRVRATYAQLIEEGIPREALDAIHAPVGLDIRAETPEEIAVAVAAELVMLHRGGTGVPLRDVERVAERFFPEAVP